MTQFSGVGADYGEQLSRGLSLTGESATHYAERRVARVRELALMHDVRARVVVDFGCGSGVAFAALRRAFPDARIIGFEPEADLRAAASREAAQAGVELPDTETLNASGDADLVYCNGVFHHIPHAERARAMQSVRSALRSRGLACVWENSPFNPGTRLVMSRIPFDHDARLLRPGALRALQESAGLKYAGTEFHFVFPRALGFLRSIEPLVRSLPLGGQYLVTGRAPQ